MPVVVVLPAEIDVTNADQVYRQLVASLAADGTDGPDAGIVIADMTSTSFCDSAGMHAIIRAHDRAAARGTALRLAVSPDGSVRRVLQLTGASLIMPVHSSVQEAMHPA